MAWYLFKYRNNFTFTSTVLLTGNITVPGDMHWKCYVEISATDIRSFLV